MGHLTTFVYHLVFWNYLHKQGNIALNLLLWIFYHLDTGDLEEPTIITTICYCMQKHCFIFASNSTEDVPWSKQKQEIIQSCRWVIEIWFVLWCTYYMWYEECDYFYRWQYVELHMYIDNHINTLHNLNGTKCKICAIVFTMFRKIVIVSFIHYQKTCINCFMAHPDFLKKRCISTKDKQLSIVLVIFM